MIYNFVYYKFGTYDSHLRRNFHGCQHRDRLYRDRDLPSRQKRDRHHLS